MEDSTQLVQRGRALLAEVSAILGQLPDQQVAHVLGGGPLDELLRSILDVKTTGEYPNLQEFLLANKTRSHVIAQLFRVISHNYSLTGTSEGRSTLVSPSVNQWFDDGVMYLTGDKPFEGLVALYRNGEIFYALAARDIRAGDDIGPDDLDFVPLEIAQRLQQELSDARSGPLDRPLHELQALLDERINDESEYQELLHRHPWVLGMQYSSIQSHPKLDDRNIPDFTGVRWHDGCRDIIEIKPPFTALFRKSGEFNANFYEYWDQAERYLHFVDRHPDYLQEKGLRFSAPECYLILGYELSDAQIHELRRKELSNARVQVLTYNDLIAAVRGAISLIRELKDQEAATSSDEHSVQPD